MVRWSEGAFERRSVGFVRALRTVERKAFIAGF
jgi:hypothetical protein